MILNYIGMTIDDADFDNKTPEQIKADIEAWCKLNWVKEETAWVCPMLDGHVSFGAEPDWREVHGS